MKFLITNCSKILIRLIQRLKKNIDSRVDIFAPQYTAFAIFGLINYPIYYFIWLYFGISESYQSFWLRLIASLLCLGLLFKDIWPYKLKTWLPIYWYVTLTYCLPFFFCFMFLKNPNSSVWIMTFTSVIFWLVLLSDLTSAFILLLIGEATAVLIFSTNNHIGYLLNHLINIAPEYIGCLIVIAVFANNKEKAQLNKLITAKAIGASIAHELRTPLSAIELGVQGAKKYLPAMLDAYQILKRKKLVINEIPNHHFEILLTLLDDIERETSYSELFISMQLYNANDIINSTIYDYCTINSCIEEALQRYPLTFEQEKLINWSLQSGFVFKGSTVLIQHVLFNLIKNALYQISKVKQGEIIIFTSQEEKFNILYFKDTAMGISKSMQSKLFQKFATDTPNGTGLGLAFCKRAMQSLHGDITCNSVIGHFTEFKLLFPK